MGIKDFLKTVVKYGDNFITIRDLGTEVDDSFINNKKIVIDALNVIYKNMYVLKEHLTHNGQITSHIKITLQKIRYFQKRGVTMLWVFDDYYNNPLKVETLQKRKVKLEKSHISDIKKLLTLCGVKWISVKTEAEFFASELTKGVNAPYNYILSTDMDIIVRGGTMIKEIHTGNKISYLYLNGEEIQNKLNISQQDIAKMAIMLGCDFAPKTTGVGPKSVFKKYKNTILTERQKQALEFYCAEIDKKKVLSENPPTMPENTEQLHKWLFSLGFTKI